MQASAQSAKPSSKSYHKENLRRDLLAAGRAFIEQGGHSELSIRTLAQQVGVSPGAPYHHFADRRAFLLALAIEGFEELTAGAVSSDRTHHSGVDRLTELGEFFIEFADRNPRLVDLMYESELTVPTVDPSLMPYENAGHGALKSAITSALPHLPHAEADLRVIAFWSTVYGYASMRRRGVIHSVGLGGMEASQVASAIIRRAARVALDD